VVTGVPVGRPTAPVPAPDFDVFTPIRRPGPDDTVVELPGLNAPPPTPRTYPDFGGPGGLNPYAGSYPEPDGGLAYQGSGPEGGNGAYPGSGTYGTDSSIGNQGDNPDSYDQEDPAGNGTSDFKGLPRRVRQANLAPQLRASSKAGSPGPTAVPPATAASLDDMRNTLSAMQRGWQQGRSLTEQDKKD
jgi:hypothetical protein